MLNDKNQSIGIGEKLVISVDTSDGKNLVSMFWPSLRQCEFECCFKEKIKKLL